MASLRVNAKRKATKRTASSATSHPYHTPCSLRRRPAPRAPPALFPVTVAPDGGVTLDDHLPPPTSSRTRGNGQRMRTAEDRLEDFPRAPPASQVAGPVSSPRRAATGAAAVAPCYDGDGRARRGASGSLYPQAATAGLNSHPEASSRGVRPACAATTAGSCATETDQPRQARKGATVRQRFRVPQGHLVRASGADTARGAIVDGGCTAIPRTAIGSFVRVIPTAALLAGRERAGVAADLEAIVYRRSWRAESVRAYARGGAAICPSGPSVPVASRWCGSRAAYTAAAAGVGIRASCP